MEEGELLHSGSHCIIVVYFGICIGAYMLYSRCIAVNSNRLKSLPLQFEHGSTNALIDRLQRLYPPHLVAFLCGDCFVRQVL